LTYFSTDKNKQALNQNGLWRDIMPLIRQIYLQRSVSEPKVMDI